MASEDENSRRLEKVNNPVNINNSLMVNLLTIQGTSTDGRDLFRPSVQFHNGYSSLRLSSAFIMK